ncbi:Glycosyl transferases group 1 [Actinomadura rubteroloni]|uniref:Glycosyl transferases group 1 n=1 Tax=Actinomadura rubteroloni TaxID=1926885 RepID=A0A2P4UL37_9ACTN|nr:glycosyltransferase [Actinomadura rubteroloni]POM25763.1 Glycosyl transferases group 1 [Actinomadura rubteroloni]
MTEQRLRALVYGDVDLNLIDGSAIWAQSMVRALRAAGCRVTLVLKAPVRTGRLVDPLTELDGVLVRHPHAEGLVAGDAPMTVPQAHAVLARVDGDHPHDLIVVRGRAIAAALADDGAFRGRLWPYLTDVPQNLAGFTPEIHGDLRRIARAARTLLCQTEELRCFLEQTVPEACGKSVLFPPTVVVPPELAEPAPRTANTPLRLVYTGKFALRWNTFEMTGLPTRLTNAGVPTELDMVGDKIHDERDDPDFADRMRRALESAPGVHWHGGHPREKAMAIAAGADIGLSWRAPELDASLELSTKVLEFGALGLPVLLNRTPMHETLLGEDYPLFAASEDDAVDALRRAAQNPDLYGLAAARCRTAADGFTLERAAERLRDALAEVYPQPSVEVAGPPLKVVVCGHDLKFFTRLLQHLAALPGLDVRVDPWRTLSEHDEERSRELAAWADVVICEWCGPNALWYARHKKARQRLIVRLHRFELDSGWPQKLDIDRVDQVVCVSPHYAALTAEATGWPAEKITVVPNWVDVAQLDRPKLPGARFHLGFIGAAPSRKRLDLAVDVVEELRRRDPRFTLFVKSKLPWEYWWIWKRPEERAHYEALFRRIAASPSLAEGVVFDGYGGDVAAWLRRVGFVLSTSDDESFHLAPAEGMASGAVPVVRNWPGADTIYDRRWIHRDAGEMADAIEVIVKGGRWDEERRIGRTQVRDAYGLPRVRDAWEEIVRGR